MALQQAVVVRYRALFKGRTPTILFPHESNIAAYFSVDHDLPPDFIQITPSDLKEEALCVPLPPCNTYPSSGQSS